MGAVNCPVRYGGWFETEGGLSPAASEWNVEATAPRLYTTER